MPHKKPLQRWKLVDQAQRRAAQQGGHYGGGAEQAFDAVEGIGRQSGVAFAAARVAGQLRGCADVSTCSVGGAGEVQEFDPCEILLPDSADASQLEAIHAAGMAAVGIGDARALRHADAVIPRIAKFDLRMFVSP